MNRIEVQMGGAITLLNGIGLGIGSTWGTSLCHTLSIEKSDGLIIETQPDTDTNLIQECISLISSKYALEIDDIKLSTNMAFPPSKGMKTSSAVATGVMDLLNKYYELSLDEEEIINLGADASINAGVSITGAIDDAYGSYKGGIWLTHNIERDVISHHTLQLDLDIIFLIPQQTLLKSDVDIELNFLDTYVLENVVEDIRIGNWKQAIEENSRVYSQFLLNDQTLIDQIEDQIFGTVGLNGTGPSLFIVSKPDQTKNNLLIIEEQFSQFELITTKLR